MNDLRNFIFVDEDGQELAQMGLADTEVAYNRAEELANEHGQVVTILEIIDTAAPDEHFDALGVSGI